MKPHTIRCLFSTVLLLAFGSSIALEVVSPDQLLDRYEFGELQWSADGTRLAFVVTEPVSLEGQSEHIWLYESAEDRLRQITRVGTSNFAPRWSPAGDSLAFLSSRDDEKTQVFILPMNGGEARAITQSQADVMEFEWSPSGDSIAFVSAGAETAHSEAETRGKDDEIVVSETVKPLPLHLVDTVSGETRSLTKGNWRVSGFTWRTKGDGLIVSATDSPSVELLTDRLFALSVDSGEMIEMARPDGPISSLSVSRNDEFLAYIGSTDGGPVPHGIYVQPSEGGDARDLTGIAIDRMVVDLAWADSGEIWALFEDGFGSGLSRLSMDGSLRRYIDNSERSITAFDVAGSTIAYVSTSAIDPEELWISDELGERQISSLNSKFPSLISPKIIRYSGEAGLDIEAALYEPTNILRPSSGWKTVLLIHGGPTGRWSNRINDWAQLFVARGYAVLAPNIRGSTGYGLDFLRSNRHDWGGADYRDAIAGVDYLIEGGVIDPERLAVAGWSYGGYMAAWTITQTGRFKAAIVGAAMTDLAVEYGTERADINAYDTWFLGSPYENHEDFVRMSPMTHVKNARTPALILIGEEDEIDPIGQSNQLYRALMRYGVDTELVIYPREPHDFKEREHRIDLMERMVAWIDKYTH